MKFFVPVICVFLMLFGCDAPEDNTLKSGIWRAQLTTLDNQQLPFNFAITRDARDYKMEIFNAQEVVVVDEIVINGDSIQIKMPVFEGYISGTFNDSVISGSFIKESLDRIVPFKARFGDSTRFNTKKDPEENISGIWEAIFSADTEDEYEAKGIFTQQNNIVSGTFRTTTGDYRYLEGGISGDSLLLSTFDGAHAFLFKAKVNDSSLTGMFYSGNHFKEPFFATRNEGFELPDETSLTFLNQGYEKIDFSFPDTSGNIVSLKDERYNNKVVVIQIMGTWCPNCLDETKFLSQYLEANQNSDVEVLALAFEYAKTKELAYKAINRLVDRIEVKYPILLAQYGSSSKTKANEKLPMLNHVLSYPTTIFIDKKGKVRKIHTGFNGPATGVKYTEFKEEFHAFVELLAKEE